MPGTSQIILLAKRNPDDVNRLMHPSFDSKPVPSDNCMLIAMPALVYEMDISELVDSNNIFVSTVTQLARIKRKEMTDNGRLYEYISDKTGLPRALVKSILDQESSHTDAESSKKVIAAQHVIKYIIYNPVSGTFYPDALSIEKFDHYTRADSAYKGQDDMGLEYRLHNSVKPQSAYLLHTDKYENDMALWEPVPLLDEVPEFRQKLLPTHYGKNDIYYTGQRQMVWTLCYCYFSDNDLSTLHLSNPVGYGNVDSMLPAMMEMLRKYSRDNEELTRKLNELDSGRRQLLTQASKWDQQLSEQENELNAMYPGLAAHPQIQKRVCELTLKLRDASDRADLVISFNDFLEDILLYCCRHGVPSEKEEYNCYQKNCRPLTQDNASGAHISSLLTGYAETAGFIASDEERDIAEKCLTVSVRHKKALAKNAPLSDYDVQTNLSGAQDIIQEMCRNGLLRDGQILSLQSDSGTGDVKVLTPDGRQAGVLPTSVSAVVSSRIKNGERYQATVSQITGGNATAYSVSLRIEGIAQPDSSPEHSSAGLIRAGRLKTLLNGDYEHSKHLPELLAVNIVQAVSNSKHPFRRLALSCHDLISTVYYSMRFRNKTKHDNEQSRTFESFVSQDVVGRTLDELLDKVLGIKKISGEALETEKRVRAGRAKAEAEAEEMARRFPALQAFRDGGPLTKVCNAFCFRDSQYFSICSNLIDKLLSDMLSEHTTSAERERTAMGFFSGNPEADTTKMQALFSEIGCEYEATHRPSTGKIKTSWNSRFLPPASKLFLCFAALYEHNRSYLDEVVKAVPEFAAVTDMTCSLRGHSDTTDFKASEDGYSSFIDRLLNCCEKLCKLI